MVRELDISKWAYEVLAIVRVMRIARKDSLATHYAGISIAT